MSKGPTRELFRIESFVFVVPTEFYGLAVPSDDGFVRFLSVNRESILKIKDEVQKGLRGRRQTPTMLKFTVTKEE
jgi:hypothetical protein